MRGACTHILRDQPMRPAAHARQLPHYLGRVGDCRVSKNRAVIENDLLVQVTDLRCQTMRTRRGTCSRTWAAPWPMRTSSWCRIAHCSNRICFCTLHAIAFCLNKESPCSQRIIRCVSLAMQDGRELGEGDDEDDAGLDDEIVREFHFGGGFVPKREREGGAADDGPEPGAPERRRSKKEVGLCCWDVLQGMHA